MTLEDALNQFKKEFIILNLKQVPFKMTGEGVRTGTVLFAFNSLIVLSGAWLLDLEKALYSIIYIFVCSRVINLVIK
ncbi:MAG: YitT family protein, partial [Desulfobacterales bacterium]